MKKFRIPFISLVLCVVVLLCSGCSAVLSSLEDENTLNYTKTMVDAIIEDDFDTAYSLVEDTCSKDEFAPVFNNLTVLLFDVESYELKLEGIYKNANISNGESVTSIKSTYKMTDNANKVYLIAVVLDSEHEKLSYFELQPYESTKLYSTGSIKNMKDASALQWILLLSNLLTIAIMILGVVDCCKQKINKKPLWLVIIILGLLTFSVSLSSSNLNFSFKLGMFVNYSSFVKYGDGSMLLQMMLPIGAIVYFIMRSYLIKKAATPPAPPTPPNPPMPQYYEQYGAQPYQQYSAPQPVNPYAEQPVQHNVTTDAQHTQTSDFADTTPDIQDNNQA